MEPFSNHGTLNDLKKALATPLATTGFQFKLPGSLASRYIGDRQLESVRLKQTKVQEGTFINEQNEKRNSHTV